MDSAPFVFPVFIEAKDEDELLKICDRLVQEGISFVAGRKPSRTNKTINATLTDILRTYLNYNTPHIANIKHKE